MRNNKYRLPNAPTSFSYCWKIFAWVGVGAIVVGLLLISACIRVPQGNGLVSHRNISAALSTEEGINIGLNHNVNPPLDLNEDGLHRHSNQQKLNADGFTLVSWNVFKGKKKGWPEDFKKFIQNSDLLALQEAYLTDHLKRMLHREDFDWDMTEAFEYRKIATGVLTAARATPSFTYMLKDKEPIIQIPKSVLFSKYPLSGTTQELLVANIHGINFTIGHDAFKNQIGRIESVLSEHVGPMIVCGDFNTWSEGRVSHVNAMTEQLELSAVEFEKNYRSRFFGHDLDHIYYRGLRANRAETPIVTTSDHNPLTVTFKLDTAIDEKD